jgi:DNA mismatch repair ATPase MutL
VILNGFDVAVQDNGCGIDSASMQDLARSFMTSKISNFQEIYNVETFGFILNNSRFRGQALHSILNISKQLKIVSKSDDDELGLEMVSSTNGEQARCAIVPFPRGTKVTAKDLFFNLPIRRNIQAAKMSAEISKIDKILTALYLANPCTRFEFKHDVREKVWLPVQSEEHAIEQVWGPVIAKLLEKQEIAIEFVRAICWLPKCTGNEAWKSTPEIYFYCNNRQVARTTPLLNDWIQTVRKHSCTNLWPICVLKIYIQGKLDGESELISEFECKQVQNSLCQ